MKLQNQSESCFLTSRPEETNDFSFKGLFKKKENTKKSEKTKEDKKEVSNGGIMTGIAGLFSIAGGLAPILPEIGIGSKSRIREIDALSNSNKLAYDSQLAILKEQNKNERQKNNMILIGITALVLIVVIVFALRK